MMNKKINNNNIYNLFYNDSYICDNNNNNYNINYNNNNNNNNSSNNMYKEHKSVSSLSSTEISSYRSECQIQVFPEEEGCCCCCCYCCILYFYSYYYCFIDIAIIIIFEYQW